MPRLQVRWPQMNADERRSVPRDNKAPLRSPEEGLWIAAGAIRLRRVSGHSRCDPRASAAEPLPLIGGRPRPSIRQPPVLELDHAVAVAGVLLGVGHLYDRRARLVEA